MQDFSSHLPGSQSTPARFFPTNRQFWQSHLALVGVISTVEVCIIVYRNWYVLPHLLRHAISITLLTTTVLLFRKLYLQRNWHLLSISKISPQVIAFGATGGIINAVAMMALLYHHFTGEFIEQVLINNPNMTRIKVMLEMLINDSLHIGIYIVAWIYIYISTTTNRRAHTSALHNLRLQNTLKEAQLNNLNNQLNPHFLFNALNNIRFMIHENPRAADGMITSLSDILRYSLANREREKVFLHEEIAIIEKQIALAKIQLEERLHVSIKIDQGLNHQLIPPMLLQLLVENAIKHGIDNIQHGGNLGITIRDQRDHIVIHAINDIAEDHSPKIGMGIGLKNIRQRLQLLYADQASIDITQDRHTEDALAQFHIIIILPKEFSRENSSC